ncbi:hypothetical protein ACFQ3Z_19810 [Streptomyces nogalater]
MTFRRRLHPALGVVVAAVVVLSACAGGDGRDRDDDPLGWSVCNQLFGADRIDRLQDEMGTGTLSVLNVSRPVGELMSDRASVARRWEPGSEVHFSNVSEPCSLGVDGKRARFESYVSWSLDSVEDIRAGVAGGGWGPWVGMSTSSGKRAGCI